MNQRNPYQGPERRVHRVYVTRNTEYHVRRGVCIAVRQRKQPDWEANHGALRMRLEGHVEMGTLLPLPGPPKLGTRLYFVSEESDVLTSPIVAILRPPKKVVEDYPADSRRKAHSPSQPDAS